MGRSNVCSFSTFVPFPSLTPNRIDQAMRKRQPLRSYWRMRIKKERMERQAPNLGTILCYPHPVQESMLFIFVLLESPPQKRSNQALRYGFRWFERIWTRALN